MTPLSDSERNHSPRAAPTGVLHGAARSLAPAYFGMVMATGIVSVAAHVLGLSRIAGALFWLNIPAYLLIWLLTILRAAWFPSELWDDLLDHQRGPGFFASVAASGVLSTQFVLITHDYAIGKILWVVTLALWLGVTYAVFMALTIKEEKPPLDKGISGAWLLAVVATQAVAVSSAHLAAAFEQPYRLQLNFLALSMWLGGGMLYIWVIALIFYRYTFFRLSPADLAPSYWINMGAMAISTLAGSLLIQNMPHAPFLASLAPFIKGFTILYWATGTWWVPMLILLVIWRHVWARFPLRYDPQIWGAVFPLGMYTVCTFEMARALELNYLYVIPRYLVYVALFAWALALAGLIRALTGGLLVVRRGSLRADKP